MIAFQFFIYRFSYCNNVGPTHLQWKHRSDNQLQLIYIYTLPTMHCHVKRSRCLLWPLMRSDWHGWMDKPQYLSWANTPPSVLLLSGISKQDNSITLILSRTLNSVVSDPIHKRNSWYMNLAYWIVMSRDPCNVNTSLIHEDDTDVINIHR